MAKTKFFRVAVEGPTVDGRVIERSHIQQAADAYNPATYTATINCEHLRGYSPTPPFNSYGAIAEMKAEEVELNIGGKTEKKLALFASFDVNDQAKKMNKDGQKLFSSIEIVPNFAASNKAYVVGLALTDSPASLGTEMLQFSRDDKRKDNLRTVEEIEIAFEEGEAKDDLTGLFAGMRKFFEGFSVPKADPVPPVVIVPPVMDDAPTSDFAAFAAQFGEGMTQLANAMEVTANATNAQVTKLATDLGALKKDFEKTPQHGYTARRPATGGDGVVMAEC
ncbi:GPO family capsid scaffolding protein [Sphingobium sp. SCG-1]|uniref:GPO family capsid scaffolding protein n=1 Tax=Sphingobium sp. SCG-1 TaxID=2072936 RepID=UPI001670CFF5|nr:GPO family capsid scaffolding protein [Sphingobium sp. SCG-1]